MLFAKTPIQPLVQAKSRRRARELVTRRLRALCYREREPCIADFRRRRTAIPRAPTRCPSFGGMYERPTRVSTGRVPEHTLRHTPSTGSRADARRAGRRGAGSSATRSQPSRQPIQRVRASCRSLPSSRSSVGAAAATSAKTGEPCSSARVSRGALAAKAGSCGLTAERFSLGLVRGYQRT